ncbi:MAG: hypothetical protein E6K11_08675 [Methanobacteriota archaeon]|nr:MAG: hypothetical protein E6K11_08675 [Euryarchaeota archaeon]
MGRPPRAFAKTLRDRQVYLRPPAWRDGMFSRKNIGSEPQKCEKCGSDKVYFVQHAHGNYPILDYVCPKCDLGGDQGVPDWYVSPTGKDESTED